jgi:hypothetical protein
MHIQQLALHYRAEADRLLLRVRSSDNNVFEVWLTRRLCLRLWPHLSSMALHAGMARAVAQVAPRATPTSQAAAMLGDAARERALQQTDFSQPFQAAAAQQPLGPEPLLAHTVQLTPQGHGQLGLTIVDAKQRSVQMLFDDSLATAVRELMIAALRQADWGLALEPPAAQPESAATRTLN